MPEPVDRKIVDLATLLERVRAARAAGSTVVHCHGCFDLVHPGHLRYLRFARQLGDVLVVSLTADDGVDKGADRPYIPQELRAESLAALEFVEWVVIDPHPTAAELLEQLRPDVYVKGREYAQMSDPRFEREREIVEGYGGRVVFHSGDVVFSSTRLLRGLERDEALDECRLRTLCARGQVGLGTARAALGRLAGQRVVVVGDLIQEHYVFCDAGGVADDAPVLSLRQMAKATYWGGAAGVALQLRALGTAVTLITVGVEGCGAAEAEADLTQRGLDVHLLPARREVVQRTTFVTDDAKVLRVSAGTCHPLDSSWERHAHALLRERLAATDVLIWCDYGYGMVTPGLLRAAAPDVRRAHVCVAGCAPAAQSNLTGLYDTDLLCVSERRLRESLHDMGSGLPSVAWHLLNSTRGRRALVTLHKRGLIGFDGRDAGPAGAARPETPPSGTLRRLRGEFVPSLAVHYADLLGVEEAVLGTAALATATGGSLAMASYLAAGAAALASGRPGRVAVTLAEMHGWLDTRPELRPQSRFLPDSATLGDIALLAPPLEIPLEVLSP